MTVEEQRNAISKVYEGKKWKDRVRVMRADQVIAIYHTFLQRGKFNIVKRENEQPQGNYIQLTLFDLI